MGVEVGAPEHTLRQGQSAAYTIACGQRERAQQRAGRTSVPPQAPLLVSDLCDALNAEVSTVRGVYLPYPRPSEKLDALHALFLRCLLRFVCYDGVLTRGFECRRKLRRGS